MELFKELYFHFVVVPLLVALIYCVISAYFENKNRNKQNQS
jgi:hypothetical protein